MEISFVMCWLSWIQTRINGGGKYCLRLKCMESSCKCSMGHEMLLSLLVSCDERYIRLYRKYLVSSYVESNRRIKWCSALIVSVLFKWIVMEVS